MKTFDVKDIFVIKNQSTSKIYQAILDEFDGKTTLMSPYLRFKSTDGLPSKISGSKRLIYVGRLKKPKIITQTDMCIENTYIKTKYIGGDFVGTAELFFSSIGTGTQITFVWKVKPNSIFTKTVRRFVSLPKKHSKISTKAFHAFGKHYEHL